MLKTIYIILIFLPTIFSFGSCTENLDDQELVFCDTVTFYAPKSLIQAVTISNGIVEEGADLGEGIAITKIYQLPNDKESVAEIISNSSMIKDFKTKTKHIILTEKQNRNKILLQTLLDSIGISKVDANEIWELSRAIEHINYGHKGGFWKGQTKFIEITDDRRNSDWRTKQHSR